MRKTKLGGSIDPQKVVKKAIDPGVTIKTQPEFVTSDSNKIKNDSIKSFHEALQRAAQAEKAMQVPQLRTMKDDLNDMRSRNLLPMYAYSHWYERHPESHIAKQAQKLVTGHGAHKDHHKLHKLMVDTFRHHPEILAKYNQG